MTDKWLRITLIVTLLLSLCYAAGVSQSLLKGRVVDETTQEPLPFASVYFNSTTNGVVTDLDGRFEIKVNPEYLELVISFLGYKPLMTKLELSDRGKDYNFQLTPLPEEIQEIVIKDKRTKRWYDHLEHFTKMFLGESSIAKKMTINNPEVLSFTYDRESQLFKAKARGPIYITNQVLGYEIEYALDHFLHDVGSKRVMFLGYPKFTEMSGKKRIEKKWIEKREAAYMGSATHFLKALHDQRASEEGFRINKITRIDNPNRPSEDQIQKARDAMNSKGSDRDLPDETKLILKQARQSKYIDYLDEEPHPYIQDLTKLAEQSVLEFTDKWRVVYINEKVDPYFMPGGMLSKKANERRLQVSTIEMVADSVIISPLGFLKDPLCLFYEGYWAFEKTAEMLPLNYIPSDEDRE